MAVRTEAVKELREETGVSVMECKKALEEAAGDKKKALEILAARSIEVSAKKAGRELGAGVVAAYVHNNGQVGALVALSCETDFVAKNDAFTALGRDIAMHAAAMQPEDIAALLPQPFIKDSSRTIADLIAAASQKFGERVEVTRLSSFSLR